MLKLHRLFQILVGRPRLWTSIVIGILVWLVLPRDGFEHAGTHYLIAWNACAFAYLLLTAHMVQTSDPDHITRRAIKQHEGRFLVLVVIMTGAVSVLLAVTSLLGPIREATNTWKMAHVALTVSTVTSTWLFIHTLFALHYAHDYYRAAAHQHTLPIAFPGVDTPPDYGDFLYAAYAIGTSGQTADVSFTTRAMRRVCLLHCTFSFFFNTTILALTINIAASLF